MPARVLLVALVWFACVFQAPAGDSLRCGSRLIAVEALAAEILGACGEPTFRDAFSYGGDPGSNVIADDEQWIYDFGPNQLLRVLKIRNGRLIDIESDGYGFAAPKERRCTSNEIAEGLSKYRLLRVCGQPLTRRNLGRVQSLQRRPHDGLRGYGRSRALFPVEVYREEWVYNLGSRYLLRVVTLEDGMVSDVQNGDRGFDPR